MSIDNSDMEIKLYELIEPIKYWQEQNCKKSYDLAVLGTQTIKNHE